MCYGLWLDSPILYSMTAIGSPIKKFQAPPPTLEQQEQKLKDVAKLYEKHFLGEMVKAMRGTVSESELIKSSQGEKIFKEQLDQQYVEKWGDKGGIGLGDMIYNQLVEKYGAQMGIRPPQFKTQGPLPLNKNSMMDAKTVQQTPQKVSIQYFKNPQNINNDLNRMALGEENALSNVVRNPWDGVLLQNRNLNQEESLVEVGHSNGLSSQMVIKGLAKNFRPGQQIAAGETLGWLNPDQPALIWNISKKLNEDSVQNLQGSSEKTELAQTAKTMGDAAESELE